MKGQEDTNGNITFAYVCENLNMNQNELMNVAKEYLTTEYKTAKYNDIQEYADKGIILGNTTLEGLYTENNLLGSNVYSTPIILRFDCKDHRVRIQIIAKEYNKRTFSDVGEPKSEIVVIKDQPPFAKGKKIFGKIYDELELKSNSILDSSKKYITSKTPIPSEEEW